MSSTRGTSLVELIVALTMLMIGMLGLIGTSVVVNACLTQGRWGSIAAAEATRRLEMLRGTASSQGCAALSGGTASLPGGATTAWSVVPLASSADLTVIVQGPRVRPETLATVIACP